jgi:hypothetical protein
LDANAIKALAPCDEQDSLSDEGLAAVAYLDEADAQRGLSVGEEGLASGVSLAVPMAIDGTCAGS